MKKNSKNSREINIFAQHGHLCSAMRHLNVWTNACISFIRRYCIPLSDIYISLLILFFACVMRMIGIFLFFFLFFFIEQRSRCNTLYFFCGANWRPRCDMRKGNCKLSLFECGAEITCRSCSANERAHWLSKRGKLDFYSYQDATLQRYLLALLVILAISSWSD